MHLTASPQQQIAHWSQLRVVHVSFGQDVQRLQIRQVKSVDLIVNMFDAAVLLNPRRTCQINRITLAAHTIHHPIPVESRFDRPRLELRLVRRRELCDLLQVALQLPLRDSLFAIDRILSN